MYVARALTLKQIVEVNLQLNSQYVADTYFLFILNEGFHFKFDEWQSIYYLFLLVVIASYKFTFILIHESILVESHAAILVFY